MLVKEGCCVDRTVGQIVGFPCGGLGLTTDIKWLRTKLSTSFMLVNLQRMIAQYKARTL